MPPLYAELLDAVVDNLDQRRDLWACALVSRDFYRAASRHLYRHLYIKLGNLAHDPGEKYCEILNTLFEAKPFVLNSVRSLQLVVPPSARGIPASHIQAKFRQATELLLRLVHAQALEELKVERQIHFLAHRIRALRLVDRALQNQLGQHFVLALLAVRCVPSLRRVELARLDGVPMVLVTGIPSEDAVVQLSVESVTFDVEASETSWTLSDVPQDGPLAIHFERARADWASIVHARTQVDGFKRADSALHTLRYLRLASVSTLYEFLSGVPSRTGYGAGTGDQARILFSLKTIHYAGRETRKPPFDGWGDTDLTPAGATLARYSPQLHTLILDLDSALGLRGGNAYIPDEAPPSRFSLKSLKGLREIQFNVQKTSPRGFSRVFGMWVLSFVTWINTAVAVLETLGVDQQLEKVSIVWHGCEVGMEAGMFVELYSLQEEWRKLQELLDCVPALSSAKMVVDMTMIWDDEIPGVTLEEYMDRMRDVWHHPRSCVRCTRPL